MKYLVCSAVLGVAMFSTAYAAMWYKPDIWELGAFMITCFLVGYSNRTVRDECIIMGMLTVPILLWSAARSVPLTLLRGGKALQRSNQKILWGNYPNPVTS